MRLRDDRRIELAEAVTDIDLLVSADAHAADIETALKRAALLAGDIARYEAVDR
jgi:hypothetical protein